MTNGCGRRGGRAQMRPRETLAQPGEESPNCGGPSMFGGPRGPVLDNVKAEQAGRRVNSLATGPSRRKVQQKDTAWGKDAGGRMKDKWRASLAFHPSNFIL